MNEYLFYAWDYKISEEEFLEILQGRLSIGRLNQEWALIRFFEYGTYKEIVSILGFKAIIKWWPKIRSHIKSKSKRRGFDFLIEWLPKNHPELI